MRRRLAATAVLTTLLVPAAATASTIRGREPIRPAHHAVHRASGALLYHGGATMRTNRTYAIYWIPPGTTMTSGYRTAINRYLAAVASASGARDNVYGPLTQYFDTTGPITYVSHFGGSTTDSASLPAGGCPVYGGLRACVTDAQLRAELLHVVATKRWTLDQSTLVTIFTAAGVGVCEGRTSSSCAFTAWCGYHASIGVGTGARAYAVVPYGETVPSACGLGQHPIGADADGSINTLSHEHREAIGDPFGTGWYDADGAEGADRCAWTFGRPLGRTATGAAYTNLIAGRPYYLQEEWSNRADGCVQR